MKRSLSYYIYAYRTKIMFLSQKFYTTHVLPKRTRLGRGNLLTKNEPKRGRS